MVQGDIDKIIDSFKEANKNLRRRAITIGILLVLTIGLVYTEAKRLEKVSDLLDYRGKLTEINQLTDTAFQEVINGSDNEYFPLLYETSVSYERLRLFERVKFNAYNRKIIEDAIDNIEMRIEEQNKEKSISILGLTIPVIPVMYVSLFIILILFHDFTQTIIYRNQTYRSLRRYKVAYWKLGFELFGFYNHQNTAAMRFIRFASSFIAGILMLCPLVTSFLILKIPNHADNNMALGIMNALFILFIIIDTLIIAYTENLWNFRHVSNLFLGRRRIGLGKMQKIWLLSIGCLTLIHMACGIFVQTESEGVALAYLGLHLFPMPFLYLSLLKMYQHPSILWRILRASMLMVTIVCIWDSIVQAFNANPYSVWHYGRISDMVGAMAAVTLISLFISYMYIRYFAKVYSAESKAITNNLK